MLGLFRATIVAWWSRLLCECAYDLTGMSDCLERHVHLLTTGKMTCSVSAAPDRRASSTQTWHKHVHETGCAWTPCGSSVLNFPVRGPFFTKRAIVLCMGYSMCAGLDLVSDNVCYILHQKLFITTSMKWTFDIASWTKIVLKIVADVTGIQWPSASVDNHYVLQTHCASRIMIVKVSFAVKLV